MKKIRRKGTKYPNYKGVPSTYLALCHEWLPRPIHDDAAHAEATEMIDALAVFQNLNEEQIDYLDAVSHFVSEYEGTYTPKVRGIDGIDALKHLVKEHNLSGADNSRILGGSRLLGPMILRGERNITIAHARKLGAYFKLNPEVFLFDKI